MMAMMSVAAWGCVKKRHVSLSFLVSQKTLASVNSKNTGALEMDNIISFAKVVGWLWWLLLAVLFVV